MLTLRTKFENKVNWFYIANEPDGQDRIFCQVCVDNTGRRITQTIGSFTSEHIYGANHKEKIETWKAQKTRFYFQRPPEFTKQAIKRKRAVGSEAVSK